MDERDFQYDVCLSFAGEQRQYVHQVANDLKSRGIPVFYDEYERENLWGKDLYEHLSDIYQNLCKYCVVFVSMEYANRVWPTWERRNAQARAVREKHEYILPARFDDTQLPGLLPTLGYIDLSETSPSQLSALIAGKLGKRERKNFLPPDLDRLYKWLEVEDDAEVQSQIYSHAWAFFDVLRRMTLDERNTVISLIRFGCPADLPDNVHINTDLLRRHTGISVTRLTRLLGGIRSLGFRCSVSKGKDHEEVTAGESLGEVDLFNLTWFNLSEDAGEFPELLVASEMIDGATYQYCEEHGTPFLERLDFSQLSNATATEEEHSHEDQISSGNIDQIAST